MSFQGYAEIVISNELSLYLSESETDIFFRANEKISRFANDHWSFFLSEEFQRFVSAVVKTFQNSTKETFNEKNMKELESFFSNSFAMDESLKIHSRVSHHICGLTEPNISILYNLMVEWTDIELDVIKECETILLEFHLMGEEIPELTITPLEWDVITNLRGTIVSHLLPNPGFMLLT